MPVTLLESKKNVLEDLQMGVIDEFAKSSWLLNNLTFDEVISPVGGGSAWDYSYTRLDTQPEAEFRAVNTEFNAHEVEKKRYTSTVSIMGGKYAIDRVISNVGGIVKETYLQASQKIKAVQTLFQETVINGSTATNALAFDGLDTLLLGDPTQETTTAMDLSSSALITSGWQQFQDELDMFIDTLDGTPSALLVNTVTKQRILACARRAGIYQTTKDDWGRRVDTYNGIPIIDLGAKMGTNDPIIGIDENGKSPIYAIRLGLDGFHGICTTEGLPVRSWFPDYSTSGAVKDGEVEMLAGVVLKASKSAGVLRGLKVK